MLDSLPDHLLLHICSALESARDLCRLERAFRLPCSDLRRGGIANMAEVAAELAIGARKDRWRVAGQSGESLKFQLFLLQELLAPLPKVAAGVAHSLAATERGQLLVFGDDSVRQLGLGDSDEPSRENVWARLREHEFKPRVVDRLADERIVAVAAGQSHSACIASPRGALFTWGSAARGAPGHGTAHFGTVIPAPRRLRQQVALVSCGHLHTALLDTHGDAYTWGRGAHGRLGHGDCNDQHTPQQVHGAPKRCVAVDCGMDTTAFVSSTGNLSICGSQMELETDGYGWKLALEPHSIRFPAGAAPVRRVSCGQRHFAAITSDGKLYTWGYGAEGRLGHGGEVSLSTPRAVAGFRAAMVVAGRGRGGKTGTQHGTQQQQPEKIAAVSCGSSHTAALTASGRLWVWGGNKDGQLGLGDFERRTVPAPVHGTTLLTLREMFQYHALDTSGDSLLSWTDLDCGMSHSLFAVRANGTASSSGAVATSKEGAAAAAAAAAGVVACGKSDKGQLGERYLKDQCLVQIAVDPTEF